MKSLMNIRKRKYGTLSIKQPDFKHRYNIAYFEQQRLWKCNHDPWDGTVDNNDNLFDIREVQAFCGTDGLLFNSLKVTKSLS